MDQRTANVIVQTPGGTASKSSATYKIALPTAWMKELGIDENNRTVDITFDGETIVISKRKTIEEFILSGKTSGHHLLSMVFYDGNTPCTKIVADYTSETVKHENYVDNKIKTAFGRNEHPNWQDYLEFLEERCIPKTRAGLREYLEVIGVDGYEPLEIIRRTKGRMYEDQQWVEIEQEIWN